MIPVFFLLTIASIVCTAILARILGKVAYAFPARRQTRRQTESVQEKTQTEIVDSKEKSNTLSPLQKPHETSSLSIMNHDCKASKSKSRSESTVPSILSAERDFECKHNDRGSIESKRAPPAAVKGEKTLSAKASTPSSSIDVKEKKLADESVLEDKAGNDSRSILGVLFTALSYVDNFFTGRKRTFVYDVWIVMLLYSCRLMFIELAKAWRSREFEFRFMLVITLFFVVKTYHMIGFTIGNYPSLKSEEKKECDLERGLGPSDEKKDNDVKDAKRKSEKNKYKYSEFAMKVGVVIPCHKSEDEIGDTLRSILPHIPPQNIMVCDNANQETPPDNTKGIAKSVHNDIQYLYIPMGLKTRALWEGMQRLRKGIQFIVHIDDDTIFDKGMVLDPKHFEDQRVSAVSYGIRMVDVSKDTKSVTFTEHLVDREFMIWNAWRNYRSITSTAWFCHGIIGLWRRDRFMEFLDEHPFLPFGEDGWLGIMNLLNGYSMKQELRSIVTTFSPKTLITLPFLNLQREQGYGASSVWKQRSRRWFVNAPRRALWRLLLFIFYDTGSLFGNVAFRIESVAHMTLIALRLLLPVIFITLLVFGQVTILAYLQLVFWGIQAFSGLIINYVLLHHRPDLQQHMKVILAYPVYTSFLFYAACVGHYRCIFMYIVSHSMRVGEFTRPKSTSKRRLIDIVQANDSVTIEMFALPLNLCVLLAYIAIVFVHILSFAIPLAIFDTIAIVLMISFINFKSSKIHVRNLILFCSWSSFTFVLSLIIAALQATDLYQYGWEGITPSIMSSRSLRSLQMLQIFCGPFIRLFAMLIGLNFLRSVQIAIKNPAAIVPNVKLHSRTVQERSHRVSRSRRSTLCRSVGDAPRRVRVL
mmetsp:Transcript_11472/g.17136  ORF Transcript_11472/g.17136 Transcript_11472/m.17136 type:complete len:869 (+) Transcript_11472:60-2666(+)